MDSLTLPRTWPIRLRNISTSQHPSESSIHEDNAVQCDRFEAIEMQPFTAVTHIFQDEDYSVKDNEEFNLHQNKRKILSKTSSSPFYWNLPCKIILYIVISILILIFYSKYAFIQGEIQMGP